MELERILYERDLQRTRWLIKSYYRTRIKKIEAFVQYYLHHEEYTARLSPQELQYATAYFTSIGRYASSGSRSTRVCCTRWAAGADDFQACRRPCAAHAKPCRPLHWAL